MLPELFNGWYLSPMLTKLAESDCRAAIAAGDFDPAVRAAAPLVAVVLTQSWCPQWSFMRGYLAQAAAEAGDRARIFFVEYDREPFYEDFMTFKEDGFGNREIPYVRYYRDGVLSAESNFISKQGFLSKLGLG
jgi:hypothetical protein